MRIRFIIVCYGNMFCLEEILIRVGVKIDLLLVEEFKGRSIGRYLKEYDMIFDVIYVVLFLCIM